MEAKVGQLKNIIEFNETDLKEVLQARNEAIALFHDIGPPDLVHILKQEKSKTSGKDLGSYHFVTGVDTSSSATCAAYLNSLSYIIEQGGQGWFGTTKPSAQIVLRSGTFCSWNAFSKLDIRVEVRIPGGVDAYALDVNQDFKIPVTAEMWTETYVSAILRSLVTDKESHVYPSISHAHLNQSVAFLNSLLMQIGIRAVCPFQTVADETRFLEAASSLFERGWQLGTDNDNSSPNLINNHMAKILVSYFATTQRHTAAIDFLSPLIKMDPEIGALVYQNLLSADQTDSAVKLLYRCLVEMPLKSSNLLKAQGTLLLNKGRLGLALTCAEYAVESNASDMSCWLLLADVYTERGDYSLALTSLNSCPMFLSASQGGSVLLSQDSSKNKKFGGMYYNFLNQLRRLPIPAHRNYPINEAAVVPPEISDDVTKLVAASTATPPLTAAFILQDPVTFFAGTTSHRDSCDVALYKLKAPMLVDVVADAYRILTKIVNKISWDSLLVSRSDSFVMEDEYKKVKSEAASGDQKSDPATSPLSPKPWQGSAQLTVSMFENKRLCERWLDSLFVILYEDLRAYMGFKAEFQQHRTDHKLYTRTPLEWELLGDLCSRLGHTDDAKECYQFYVEQRYSFRIWYKLLKVYVEEGKPHMILSACEKLISTLDRWKSADVSHLTSPISAALFKLAREHGVEKLKTQIVNMKMNKRNETVMLRIFEMVCKFHQADQ